MVGFAVRILTVTLLLWAMILPKVAGVLLEWHPNIQTVVICTGTDMVTLTIGPNGKPIEVESEEDAPCVMTEETVIEVDVRTAWIALARDYRATFIAHPSPLNGHLSKLLNRTSQGPPLA